MRFYVQRTETRRLKSPLLGAPSVERPGRQGETPHAPRRFTPRHRFSLVSNSCRPKLLRMLRVGHARVEITPGPELSLIGYDFRQSQLPPGNAGVLDPLFARALALDDRIAPALIVSLDLCVLETPLSDWLRDAIARKTGVPRERILLLCSHTHSGPFPQLPASPVSAVKPLRIRRADPARRQNAAYARLLRERLLEVCVLALGLRVPCTVGVAEGPLGLGYNRRVRTPQGVRLCWNPTEFPELEPGPSPDPTCTVLGFRALKGDANHLLFSAGYHPVVLGKTSRVVSADWPGAACRIAGELLPGTTIQFAQGASGEVHPWIATQADPEAVTAVGRASAATVALMAAALHSSGEPDGGIAVRARRIRFGRTATEVAVWRIGGVPLVALPVELFASLSARLRREIGGPLFLATLANGWECYWPDRAAFDEGAYEVDAARAWGRKPGDGERLIEAVQALLRER
jgi:hypothetical protein